MHDNNSSAEIDPATIKAARPRRFISIILLIAVAGIAVAAGGIRDRAKGRQELVAWTNEQAVPSVAMILPVRGPSREELVLPGTISAFNRGTIYARASGYVTSWNVDIGAHVKKGQVLATIDAPDLDQQLLQARADLASAKANLQLAELTLQRRQSLANQNIVSQQTKDEAEGDKMAKAAAVKAAEANVARLEALSAFKDLQAPFDGVVTARSLDVGDLVNAGGTSGKALFQVSDLHKVRIYVNVPQASLADMKPGVKATLKLPGRAETFEAELTTTSNSLTENNRSALVQLQADNPDDVLWPGAYAEVHFHLPTNPNVVRVPATALLFGADGLRVATVDSESRLVMKPIQLGRNFGKEVEIVSGLAPNEPIVDGPPESLSAGQKVRIEKMPQPLDASAPQPLTKEAEKR